ncbi:MAG TPA: peptidylprolyl isomerase [Steroidobacteraceae bacterium]|nr:peptidylprolyl isomerase [Steroidobacteraceae bacterium]
MASRGWRNGSRQRSMVRDMIHQRLLACAALLSCAAPLAAAPAAATGHRPPTAAEVLASSSAGDWRVLDPQNTLYLELPSGRVVIELMPQFAPNHVANVLTLARGRYFDGLAIVRSQDNYVVQWGDPDGRKPVGAAHRTLAAEFERPLRGLSITRLPDADTYAAEVGFVEDFPVAADPATGRAWLVHCYGMVGAGRDTDVDSGGGTELYVVIGQAPRHLDRNVTLLGRVVSGMERLSVTPRGTGPLGRYEHTEQYVPLTSLRVAAEVPPAQRTNLEVLRTDTPTFLAYLEARRNRHEEWFKVPAGHVDVCNVPLPARPVTTAAPTK